MIFFFWRKTVRWFLSPVEKYSGSFQVATSSDYWVDMMSSVYYSFAMENAHPYIKKLARFTTASNKEHGGLQGIQKLIDDGLCG